MASTIIIIGIIYIKKNDINNNTRNNDIVRYNKRQQLSQLPPIFKAVITPPTIQETDEQATQTDSASDAESTQPKMAMTSENGSDTDTWCTRWSDITNFTNASFEIRRLSDKSLSYDLENNVVNADNVDDDDDDYNNDDNNYNNNGNDDDDAGGDYDDNDNDGDNGDGDYDEVNDDEANNDANDNDDANNWKLMINAGTAIHLNRRRNEPFYINNHHNISYVCPPSPSTTTDTTDSTTTPPLTLTHSDPHIYSGL